MLFLFQNDRQHLDSLGKSHDFLNYRRIGLGIANDLSRIEDPDMVGKVQMQELCRPINQLNQLTWHISR